MFNAMAAAALELAINQALALALNQYQDEAGQQQLQVLDGKVIAIDLQGLDSCFYLLFNGDSIQVQSHCQGEADACIAGTPLSLLRMRLASHQQQLLFGGDVSISGDVEVGRQVSTLLDHLNIDWEEHLSHLLGDVLAHGLGSRVRELSGWARQTLATLSQDSAEYLHEEARILAPADELELFLTAVDKIRDDVARLEKRLERLQSQTDE